MSEPEICLRRAPGTCFPEPTYDYIRENPITECESCGKSCDACRFGKASLQDIKRFNEKEV